MRKEIIVLILLIIGLAVPSAFSQNNTLILNGGNIILNGGTNITPSYIVVNQSDTAGIVRTTSGGYIQSENQYNYVKWETSTATGQYIFPFGLSGDYIPMTFEKMTAANSPISQSTWHTNQQNSPKPATTNVGPVTSMTGYTDSVKYAIDRFWDINTNTGVSANLTFSYLGSENTTAYPTNHVKAQHWNGSSWDVPVSSVSNSFGVNSGVGSAGSYLNQNTFSPWTLIVEPSCPSDSIYYAQNNQFCSNDSPLQSVSHLNDTLTGTFSSTPSGLTINTTTGQIDLSTSKPGNYTVTYSVPANGGCPAISASANIEINAAPTADASSLSDSVCPGSNVILNGNGGVNYGWTGPNGFSSSNQNVNVTNFSSNNVGDYILTVTDGNGCSDIDSVHLNLLPAANVDGSTSANVVCPGTEIVLNATGSSSYSWSGPDGFTEVESSVSIQNAQSSNAGVYSVTGTNQYGCTSTDTVNISVETSSKCVFVPQLVTFNLDGKNETWNVAGLDAYPNAEVSIFNRWGNLVFHAKPYKNDWSGQTNSGVTLGSDKLPAATYFYIINFHVDGMKDMKGYIELQY